MGAVYLAKDLRFEDSYVALKKITIEFDKLDEKQQKLFKSAFEREANLLAKLSHESIPRVTDYFSESDSQYLVMELVDGDDLGALLAKQKNKRFAVKEVLEWSFQILDALDYLHNQNPPIIHRDLKPANLKLTSRGRVKLLDFGIAKGTDGKSNNHTTITNHTFVGATLNYSPIEQLFRVIDPNYRDFIIEKFADKAINVLNQNADTRSDTFALGATFYHLTTGVLPNDALKRALDVWGGKADPLQNPSHLNPDISPEISNILMKSLSTDVDARYMSAKEMSNAFHEAVAASKSKKSTKKNSLVTEFSNFPIPPNPDETQPFFPQQMDLGEKTQVEINPGVNSAITQVEPLSNLSPVSNEPEMIIQDTQVEMKPASQETQLNPVTYTQEPKLDSATITEKPINDEVTRLPIANNADLTGVSFINKVLPEDKPSERPTEQFKIPIEVQREQEKQNQNRAAAGLSKNSILALASTAGIGFVILLLIAGIIIVPKLMGGGGKAPETTNNPVPSSNSNGYIPAPTDTPASTPTITSTSTPTPVPTATKPQATSKETPVPAPTKPAVAKETPAPTTAKPKCRRDPNDKSDACVFEGKCRQVCN